MTTFFSGFFQLELVTVEYMEQAADRPALEDITLELTQGSWTAIVGGNGSGKSTLTKVLAGILPISKGKLSIRQGAKIHMILQNPETQILGETIEEELRLSMKAQLEPVLDSPEQELQQLLAEVGLSLPLDTPIRQLSGGQKQLLNMASCLAAESDAILFDECTSMLDPSSRELVLQAASKLHKKGKTIVWVTHRTEELCHAERVVLLNGGRLAFEGDAETFFYGDTRQTGTDPLEESPCERFGLEAPYTVQVARALQCLGHSLPIRPLFPHQISQAVMYKCLYT
jgi:energy-coupling factor transport system ATP-binding protein